MKSKIILFLSLFLNLNCNVYGNPEGLFSLFYNGSKNNQNVFFQSDVLEVNKNTPAHTVFPALWGKVVHELNAKNIVLEYEEFFKNCTQSLVDFALDPHSTEKKTLNMGNMQASFRYNQEELSKEFCIENPDVTGNRAWIKFYTYTSEEDEC